MWNVRSKYLYNAICIDRCSNSWYGICIDSELDDFVDARRTVGEMCSNEVSPKVRHMVQDSRN